MKNQQTLPNGWGRTKHRRHQKARSAVTTGAASLALLLAVGVQPVASQGVGAPSGSWFGYMTHDTGAVFETPDGQVPVEYRSFGSFEFITAVGFATGTYRLNVKANLIELGAVADAVATGQITGPATEIEMALEGMSVSSTASNMTMDLDFTAAELGNPRGGMVMTGGTCDNLHGTWNQEFALGMAEQGGSVNSLSGTWSAVRSSSLGDNTAADIEARMESFSAHGQTILDQVRAGSVESSDLRDYLRVAEAAVVAGTIRSNCDEGTDSGMETQFRSFAAATVENILEELALGDFAGIDDQTFLSLMLAGYRTGTFDSDTGLRDFYESELQTRVSDALLTADVETLQRFLASASQFGMDELAADILALLEGLDR